MVRSTFICGVGIAIGSGISVGLNEICPNYRVKSMQPNPEQLFFQEDLKLLLFYKVLFF